jgi:hypothetical protein
LIIPVWLEVDQHDIYNFSPFLLDKVAIKATRGNIRPTIDGLLKVVKITITTVYDIQQKIEHLNTCSDDRKQKYYLDSINRINNIFHYQEEYYNWYMAFDEDEWDDESVNLKGKELERDYNLPNGVWLNSEPFNWLDIERAKELISKWVFGELTYVESAELHFVLDEILDTDIYFILYGFPHSTIRSPEVHQKVMEGIAARIAPKEKNKKIPTEKRLLSYLFRRYYGVE